MRTATNYTIGIGALFLILRRNLPNYLKRADHNCPFLIRDEQEKNNFTILTTKVYAQITALLYLTAQVNGANPAPEKVYSFDETASHFHVTLPPPDDTTYTRLFSDAAFQDLDRNVMQAIQDEETARLTVRHILRAVSHKLPLPAIVEKDPEEDLLIDLPEDDLADDLEYLYDDENGIPVFKATPAHIEADIPQSAKSEDEPPVVEETPTPIEHPKALYKLFIDARRSLHLCDHAYQRGDYLILFHIADHTILVDRVLSLDDHNLYLLYEDEDDGLFDYCY